jgi:hypothetical protein
MERIYVGRHLVEIQVLLNVLETRDLLYTYNGSNCSTGFCLRLSSGLFLTEQGTVLRTTFCVRTESDLVTVLVQYIYWSLRA